MAIGIIRQIASGTHQQVTIPSGNYPWPTIRVLNPNDGVVYVKQNADITSIGYGSWDYKVPSQSFGLLPGEGQGWQSVGLYYLDQSGSGANGEISIYLTQQEATEPVFVSIGRAIVSQTTSMDVVQGSQPANPGAGITRLWSDTSGNLNILLPSGTDKVVLDSSNYGTYISLLGDVVGPVSNTVVHLRNGSYIDVYDAGGTLRNLFGVPSNNYVYFFNAGGQIFVWVNQSASSTLMTLDNSGNLGLGGSLTVPGTAAISGALTVAPGDIHTNRGNNTGYIFFGNANANYIGFDGSNLYHNTNISMPRGSYLLWGDTNAKIWDSASDSDFRIDTWLNLYVNSMGYGTTMFRINYPGNLYMYGTTLTLVNGGNLSISNAGLLVAGSIAVQGTGITAYAFSTANSASPAGQGYANAWINASSKDFKKNIIPIGNPLGILLNPALRGVEYDHEWTLEAIDGVRDAISGTTHHIGFVADDWLPHVPEIVAVDKTGKPEGMDYARITSLLWEALREYIDKTDKRLSALEPIG